MPSLLESLSSGLYIVYAGVDEKDQVALYVISMDGTLEGQLAQGGGTYVRLSPDGKHVAFSADAYTTFSVPLSVLDLEDNATTRIAAEKPCDHPTWSSDGMKLAAGCSGGIYLISVPDGKMSLGIPESTSEFPEFPDWSPDGRWLSYYAHLDCQCTSDEIGPYLVEASCLAENSSCGTSDRRRLGQLSLAAEGIRAWSPDSLELAVWSDSESIFVFEVASGHLQRKLDVRDYTPVRSLAWSPDGKWLAVVQENLRAPNRLEVIPSGGGKAVLTYVDERSKITGIFWLRIP